MEQQQRVAGNVCTGQVTMRLLAILSLAITLPLNAAPMAPVGDAALRHDIQLLSDFGIIDTPVQTWPLDWAPILAAIDDFDQAAATPPDVLASLYRLRSRGEWETRTDTLWLRAHASVQENRTKLRGFQATPREDAAVGLGASYTGDLFSIDVGVTAAMDPDDGDDARLDNSQLAIALGNWTLAASTLDRWWGPAWDSSLVLSNNARPIPALTLDRRFNDPFGWWGLRWLGPWDLSVIWGQLESSRTVPDARFLAARFSFRPIRALEIGISRTALWCGLGRPCGFDTFLDLLAGRDNRGDDGVTVENEPGNQTATLDFRFSMQQFGWPVAAYGQFMAEDEAGGFPSRYLGLGGIDGTAAISDNWSLRWYAELAMTSCDFWKSEERFNCAYNHFIYSTGYRYKGRVIGHTTDGDSRTGTAGFLLVNRDEVSWQGLVRVGRINRGGAPDTAHSLTPLPLEIVTVELIHNRPTPWGRFEVGVAYDEVDGNTAISGSNDVRAFIQWRSDY